VPAPRWHDGVQEYKVITNLASAEYPSGMGAQTTISSKRGGNELHGDVFEYIRNSSLDANNYFDVRGTPNNPAPVLDGKRIPPFRRNQLACGERPIHRDKMFYAVDYEGCARSRATRFMSASVTLSSELLETVPADRPVVSHV